jgi:hypothetical protein
MKNDPRDELRLGMGLEIRDQLMDHPEITGEKIRDIVDAIIKGWSVTRKDYPNIDQHPLEDDSHGHRLVLTGPFVPETDEERIERELWYEAYSWSADDGPPPVRVGVRQLLRQDTWWRMNATPERQEGDNRTVAIRVEDMTHDHRLALLAWLRSKARNLHASVFTELRGAPDDVWSSHERQSPREWLEEQELIQALVHWTTPVAESPLTWRPMNEAPSGAQAVIVVRYQGPDGELTAQVTPSLPYGWVTFPDYDPLMVSDGLGGFDYADPTGWRELRDDELPKPVEPFDTNCDHGYADDEHCPQCCGDC